MTLVLQHARIIDGCGGHIDGGTLVVEGSHISRVGPDKRVSLPRGCAPTNARGWTVLPGLIDCHVHFALGGEADVFGVLNRDDPARTLLKAANLARRTVEAGFTTVRDLGFRGHGIFALKQAIDEGLLPGPRILAAGQAICITGGHARIIGRQADGPDAITVAVREEVAAGADVIKLIATGGILTSGTDPERAQMTPEEIQAGVSEARRAGRRIAAHAHGAEGMVLAVNAGVHSIEHATLLDKDTASLMRRAGTFLVPTLSALATTVSCGLDHSIPEPVVHKAQSLIARHQESFKTAHRQQIPIALGTDAGTPFNHHGENAQELERMVNFGMSPMEALVSATGRAAHLLAIDQVVGTIQPGKLADLVIVRGNPLERIGILRDPDCLVGVIQGGKKVRGDLGG